MDQNEIKEKASNIINIINKFSSRSKIEAISEVVYPKETKTDIDGYLYDINENRREGFMTGCLIFLQQLGVDIDAI